VSVAEWSSTRLSPSRAPCEQCEYLDKNYGGVLLVWDHLFGSYQAERPSIPIRYAVASALGPNNPLVIAYEGLWLMLKAGLVREHARATRPSVGPP